MIVCIYKRKVTFGRDVYYRAYSGYLEEMYAGIGAEFFCIALFSSRLAFGFNLTGSSSVILIKILICWIIQLLPVMSAPTGNPWYNYDVAVHAGQYLAKDVGATIEVRGPLIMAGWLVPLQHLQMFLLKISVKVVLIKVCFFRIPLDQILPGNTRSCS